MTQQFPEGADVHKGDCDGVWCFTKRRPPKDVATARVGPSWDQALAMELCAECLADFAVAGTVIDEAHLYVLAVDGRFHEVTGNVAAGEP